MIEQRIRQAIELLGAEVLDLDAPALLGALDADAGLEPLSEAIGEALQVWILGAARARGRDARCGGRPGQLFSGAHRELLGDDAIAEALAPLRVREREQRLGVTQRDAARLDVALDVARELEQPQMIGDRRAIHSDALADLLLGGAGVGERPEGDGELDRVQVAALDVLDEGDLEAIAGIDLEHDGGDRVQARAARRPPASLAHDQLVAIARAPHHHRLQHPVHADRLGEGVEGARLEDATGLVGVGVDVGNGDLARARGRRLRGVRGRRGAGRRRAARNQRADPAAEGVAGASGHSVLLCPDRTA
jgi:hypothetical protein